MTLAQPSGFMQDPEALAPDPRSSLPIVPTEAMVRQAEVDAAYLAVEAARGDPIYQAELQAKATEARDWAHRLRVAMAPSMPYEVAGGPIGIGEPEALAKRAE
jgi:hypothetical protein